MKREGGGGSESGRTMSSASEATVDSALTVGGGSGEGAGFDAGEASGDGNGSGGSEGTPAGDDSGSNLGAPRRRRRLLTITP